MIGLNSISYPVDAPDAPDAQVVADGWFPPITLDRVRTLTQLGSDTTETQLTSAIEGAMLTVFRQVVGWRKTHVLAGAADLAAVTDQTLNDRNQAEVLWERAVSHHAHADLSSGDLAMSATDSGMNSVPGKEAAADEARRKGDAAIADLLSIGAEKTVQRNSVRML
jgi:hypothetical protein